VSENIKLSLSFSCFSSQSWREITRHNTALPPLKLVAKCCLFLAISFLLFLIITKHFLGLFYTNASKLEDVGSSTEDTVNCSSLVAASGGQLSAEGKQSSSLGPAAQVHQDLGEASPACSAAPLCESHVNHCRP